MKTSLEARGGRVNQTEGMLASHNPKHPLFKRFPNHLNVGTHWLEWTTRGADLFARPLNADVEIVWCWPSQYNAALERDSEQRVLQVVQQEKALRFLPFDEGEILLLGQSSSFLRSDESPLLLRFSLPSRFWGSAKVLKIEPSVLEKRVEKLRTWKDLLAARELIGKFLNSWEWLHWERGSYQEIEPLIKALLVLFAGEFSFSPSHKRTLNFTKTPHFYRPEGVERHPTFCYALGRSFSASVDPQILRIFISPSKRASARLIRIQRRPEDEPTAHERLEALLLWRDFLRDKLPPEEIAALLTPIAT